MADILVTTPKTQMRAAAREAEDVKRAGGGEYFRRIGDHAPGVHPGDRVYYVEDGYIRGYCIVKRVEFKRAGQMCDTTGYLWQTGWYVFMDAPTWHWVRPIKYAGFQGWRYLPEAIRQRIQTVGSWLDPRPEVTDLAERLS